MTDRDESTSTAGRDETALDIASDTASLLPNRQWIKQVKPLSRLLALIAMVALVVVAVAPPPSALPQEPSALAKLPEPPTELLLANASTVAIYLGNGCFWERQWAYFNVETDSEGPFQRAAALFTAKVGYAGGRTPPGTAVCYHTSDARDYSRLGHAEVVRVSLDAQKADAQMGALAADFFASFTDAGGGRQRPDPMDVGRPYRSVVGLPGGVRSPLYATFAAANRYGMALKPGAGGDADEFNTVWVYDSDAFPYYDGEVYHQNHCNFFASEGMPYPDSYTIHLWDAKKAAGAYVTTGCPEVADHDRCGGARGWAGRGR